MTQTELWPLLVAVGLSTLSGIGVYLHGAREKRIDRSFFSLMTEIVLALTAGLAGFYLAKHWALDEGLTFICVLAASNNGREVLATLKSRVIGGIGSMLTDKTGGGK